MIGSRLARISILAATAAVVLPPCYWLSLAYWLSIDPLSIAYRLKLVVARLSDKYSDKYSGKYSNKYSDKYSDVQWSV